MNQQQLLCRLQVVVPVIHSRNSEGIADNLSTKRALDVARL